jgi:inosose dehydratase
MSGLRWGTNLITFSHSGFWGLGEELSHPEWASAFRADARGFFDRMLDLARDAGLDGVELAPDPALWDDALAAYGTAAKLRAALDERGLVCYSAYAPGRQLIGAALADPRAEAVADDYFDGMAGFLAEMGGDLAVIGNIARSRFGNDSPDDTATVEDFTAPVARETHERFADQLNRIGAVVGRHGVRLAIHTDAFSVCSRNEDIATVLELTDPSTVQLCPDAGHIALDSGDPVTVLRDHIDRVPTMHWKDCAAPLSGHLLRGDQKERHSVMLKQFRVLGSGSVDWAAWVQVLKDSSWSGWATEEIDASPDPVGELKQGLDFFRTQLAPIYR